MVGASDWHPGVIGIVASRLKDRFNKPACVVSFDDTIGKGSGRSIVGIHMGDTLHKAVHLRLLDKGGGHAMAAGFTIQRTSYDAFYAFLCDEWCDRVSSHKSSLSIDGFIKIRSLTPGFLDQLTLLEPFGIGNPQPRFVLQNLYLTSSESIGNGHRRCFVKDEEGKTAKLMAFRIQDTPLESALVTKSARPFDALVTVKEDHYGGRRSLHRILEDMAY
jgi:single-stranded-DNA-specific exonuclease